MTILAVAGAAMLTGVHPAQESGGAEQPDQSPPHLVLITLDDVGVEDFGCYGAAPSLTPSIDRLAAEGVCFTRSYASAAICSPSRFAMQTGLNPVRLGLSDVFGATSRRGVGREFPMLAERLSERGYRCVHIGKWHLGRARPEYRPQFRGYDEALLYRRAGRKGFQLEEVSAGTMDGVEVEHSGTLTAALVDRAIAALEVASGPTFVNLCLHAAHNPLQPPEAWARRFEDSERGRFMAVLAFADEQIGRLCDALQTLGLEDRTLVVVTSDNGPLRGLSRSELNGGKSGLGENGLRVPLVARWPGHLAAARDPRLVSSADVCATLLEAAGAQTAELDGRSCLTPDPENVHRTLYWALHQKRAMLRDRWKLIATNGGDSSVVLYDLEEDPGETSNLAGRNPEQCAALAKESWRWFLDASRIPLPSPTSGPVDRAAREGDFPLRAGQVLSFPSSPRWDTHDGTLTLRLRVVLRARPQGQSVAFVRRQGSWRLTLDPSGRICLLVMDPSVAEPRRLRSRGVLGVGSPTEIVFTILGVRAPAARTVEENAVSLFVDGTLQERCHHELVRSSDSPVVVGSAAADRADIEILSLEAYSMALDEEAVSRLFFGE